MRVPFFPQQAPLSAIEIVPKTPEFKKIVQRLHQFKVFKSVVTKQLPNVSEVLLFNVRVIVLVIGA